MKYPNLDLETIEGTFDMLGGIEGAARLRRGELVLVEATSFPPILDLVIRKVRVDRTRTPQAALEATGRVQYVTLEVVEAMPKGVGDEVEVVFFKPDLSRCGGRISDDDLDKEFGQRGLKPADSYSLAAVNEANPGFADTHPNGTHWKGADGKWCYAAFDRGDDRRRVDVNRRDYDWFDFWWFAGVRK